MENYFSPPEGGGRGGIARREKLQHRIIITSSSKAKLLEIQSSDKWKIVFESD